MTNSSEDNFLSLISICTKLEITQCLTILRRNDILSLTALKQCQRSRLEELIGKANTDLLTKPSNDPIPTTTDLPYKLTTTHRPDFPVIQPTKRGRCTTAAAAAMTSELRLTAVTEFRRDIYSNTSRAPMQSKWNTWCKLAKAWNVPPLPITKHTVECLGAAMKQGGYRSASKYFERARREHVSTYGCDVDKDVMWLIKDAIRSITRGMGPSKSKHGMQLELLGPTLTKWRFNDQEDSNGSSLMTSWASLPCGFCVDPVRMVILGSWFLTRGIETAAARLCHINFNDAARTVTWYLPVSKTDTEALGAHRSHGCSCTTSRQPLCPYHIAKEHIHNLRCFFALGTTEDQSPLFPDNDGHALTHTNFVLATHTAGALINDPGIVIGPDGKRKSAYAEHVLRVSGAQMLARAGIELYVIQLLGRWGGDSIRRYVQDAPLINSPSIAARVVDALVLPTDTELEPTVHNDDNMQTVTRDIKDLQSAITQLTIPHEFVINTVNRKAHAILLCRLPLNPRYWRARCGWAYALVDHETQQNKPEPQFECKQCFRTLKTVPLRPDPSSSSRIRESSDSSEKSSSDSSLP